MRRHRILPLFLALALCAGLLSVPTLAWETPYPGGLIYVDDTLMVKPGVADAVKAFIADAAEKGLSWDDCRDGVNGLVYEMVTGESFELQEDHHPDCDFDPATGTVLKVRSKAREIYFPEEIDGVTIRAFAPGAISGMEQLTTVGFPQGVTKFDSVIIRDCPNLDDVYTMAYQIDISCRIYEGSSKVRYLESEWPYDEREFRRVESEGKVLLPDTLTEEERKLYQPLIDALESPQYHYLPQMLLTELKVFRGSDSGMNWEGQLTRAEAATILLRLLGLEEEAQAKAAEPSPFTDVPAWANGYVNLAYEKGMVQGVGGGRFDPSGLCGAREFSLMLLRLTDHTEGTDYAWATAIRDLQELIAQGRALYTWTSTGAKPDPAIKDGPLYFRLYNDPAFTRQYACALAYRALSVPMADGMTSLADELCRTGAQRISTLAPYDVRLTAAALNGRAGDDVDPQMSRDLLILMDEQTKREVWQARKGKTYSDAVQAKADEITAGLTGDYAKGKAICDWVAENIACEQGTGRISEDELEALLADKELLLDRVTAPTLDAALTEGRCDYAGLGKLTQALLDCAGVPNVYVDPLNCNEFYADGRWFPVDQYNDCLYLYRDGETIRQNVFQNSFEMTYEEFYRGRSFNLEWKGLPFRPFK